MFLQDDWPTLKPYIPPGHRITINDFVKKINNAISSQVSCLDNKESIQSDYLSLDSDSKTMNKTTS